MLLSGRHTSLQPSLHDGAWWDLSGAVWANEAGATLPHLAAANDAAGRQHIPGARPRGPRGTPRRRGGRPADGAPAGGRVGRRVVAGGSRGPRSGAGGVCVRARAAAGVRAAPAGA